MPGERRLPVTYDHERPEDAQKSPFTVTSKEIKQYAEGKICGNCAKFEPGHAQVEMMRQQFLPKLVKELEWKPEHLGAAITSEGGLCGDDGVTLTATFTVACPNWREDKGRIKRRATPSELEALEGQRRTMQRMHRERMSKQRIEYLKRIGAIRER